MDAQAFPDAPTAFTEGPCAHSKHKRRKHALGPMPQELESAAGEMGGGPPGGDMAGLGGAGPPGAPPAGPPAGSAPV